MNIYSVITKKTPIVKKKKSISVRKSLRLYNSLKLSKTQKSTLNMLKDISDFTKFKILLLLYKEDYLSVKDISLVLKVSPSAVSHALSDLKDLGLVDCERCGRLRCYFLNKNRKTKKIIKFLRSIL